MAWWLHNIGISLFTAVDSHIYILSQLSELLNWMYPIFLDHFAYIQAIWHCLLYNYGVFIELQDHIAAKIADEFFTKWFYIESKRYNITWNLHCAMFISRGYYFTFSEVLYVYHTSHIHSNEEQCTIFFNFSRRSLLHSVSLYLIVICCFCS